MSVEITKRKHDEEFQDYFVRLFENKYLYKLTCEDITKLLNFESGLDKGESAWRKEWAAFNRGRTYERNLGESGIATRILVASDFHIPFNLPIEIFKDYVGCVDVLVLNGDVEDCQSCSVFPKQYRVSATDEMIMTREYVIDLINYISPKKKVIFVKGNHEARLGRYLSDKLNEDLLNIMPDTPMDLIVNEGFKNRDRLNKTETWYSPLVEVFDESSVEINYTGDWHCKIGNTIFAHPLAYSSGMLKTTEKAVNFFLRNDRTFEAVVLAHTHKLGSYIQGNIKMYEQGCCCDLTKLNYADGKLQLPGQNGFLYMCHDINGNIISEKTKLVEI